MAGDGAVDYSPASDSFGDCDAVRRPPTELMTLTGAVNTLPAAAADAAITPASMHK